MPPWQGLITAADLKAILSGLEAVEADIKVRGRMHVASPVPRNFDAPSSHRSTSHASRLLFTFSSRPQADKFPWLAEREDVHMNIESSLIARVGDPAKVRARLLPRGLPGSQAI